MAKHEINIKVSGLPKTGKSTLMHIITRHLQSLGFSVCNDQFEYINNLDQRIAYLSDRIEINMNERQSSVHDPEVEARELWKAEVWGG